MKVAVLLGSARENGTGVRVGQWVRDAVSADSRFELDFVPLVELGLPFFNEEFSPKYRQYMGKEYANADGKAWADRVGAADAFVIVTPEYNHGYPALLKNSLDWVGPEWSGKPVAFVGYSIVPLGGVRSVEQLREVAAELNLQPVNLAVLVGNAGEAISEKGVASSDELNAALKTALESLYDLGQKLTA
jgi:NAD(P)H-dependent FMN reductase